MMPATVHAVHHWRRQPLALLPLLSLATAAIFAGCGSIAADSSATPWPTAEPGAPVAAAVAQAEATVTAVSAKAGNDYCGRLCQPAFWLNASVADLDAEISKGASVNATGGVGYKGNPLHYAVWYADISVIAALLERGADLEAKNYTGDTALHIVALPLGGINHTHLTTHRHSEQNNVAALLLERGADANAQDDWGLTPLHQARNPVVAALLLNYGADVNAAGESGWTPLFSASSSYGASDTVALLLEHGADTSVLDDNGDTLLFAALHGNADADVVALLLEHGVDIDAKNSDGLTACQFANSNWLKPTDAIRELVCP